MLITMSKKTTLLNSTPLPLFCFCLFSHDFFYVMIKICADASATDSAQKKFFLGGNSYFCTTFFRNWLILAPLLCTETKFSRRERSNYCFASVSLYFRAPWNKNPNVFSLIKVCCLRSGLHSPQP